MLHTRISTPWPPDVMGSGGSTSFCHSQGNPYVCNPESLPDGDPLRLRFRPLAFEQLVDDADVGSSP